MATPTRRVFFSFHYQRDIWRVQQVKNHWVTKDSKEAAGFFDGSLEEKAKKEGDAAVKKLINDGLVGSSVLCVLIGTETYTRRWVDYEVFKSVELGMGVFGVRIHQLKNKDGNIDSLGSNPFSFLGYGTKHTDSKMHPMINYKDGWRDAPLNGPINESAAPYLNRASKPNLSSLFSVYDWVDNDGYTNFSAWVASAAKQADR